MSRLSLIEGEGEPQEVKGTRNRNRSDQVIRNRKQKPLHPEEIHRQLREKSSQLLSLQMEPKEWLLILWVDDPKLGRIKRYSDLTGEYDKVCSDRDHILESRDDVHGHMLIWKTERWKCENS